MLMLLLLLWYDTDNGYNHAIIGKRDVLYDTGTGCSHAIKGMDNGV